MLISPQDLAFPPSTATTIVGSSSSSYSPLCAATLTISSDGVPRYTALTGGRSGTTGTVSASKGETGDGISGQLETSSTLTEAVTAVAVSEAE